MNLPPITTLNNLTAATKHTKCISTVFLELLFSRKNGRDPNIIKLYGRHRSEQFSSVKSNSENEHNIISDIEGAPIINRRFVTCIGRTCKCTQIG